MTEPIDPTLRGLSNVQGPSQIGGASRPEKAGEQRGPAFQALLEQLQQQARELEDSSRSVERPEDLAKAVGRAQDSLAAALSFGDQLLEAYRERMQRAPDEQPGSGGGA